MNVKPKTQTKHRQGTLVAFTDMIHELTDLFYGSEKDLTEEEREDEVRKITRKIRLFDITTIGDLYLTSGGRIVLDKGYGEYFGKEEFLCSLKDLTNGIKLENFKKLIAEKESSTNSGDKK